jgi:hypothetical protein
MVHWNRGTAKPNDVDVQREHTTIADAADSVTLLKI